MNEPSGELVEVDLYFRKGLRADVFRQVVKYCCANGGTFAGSILATEGSGARQRRFTSIYGDAVREIGTDANELANRLSDDNFSVVKVPIWSALGITPKTPEIVTYCGISPEASECDNPPIAVVGEGWALSTPGYENMAKKLGKQCYQKFVEMCSALDPDYAAILNEDSLPSSYDLGRGRGKECFSDFFVSERAYGSEYVSELLRVYEDAYTERLPTGVYVSTWAVFNPRQLGIDRGIAFARSAGVAWNLRMK